MVNAQITMMNMGFSFYHGNKLINTDIGKRNVASLHNEQKEKSIKMSFP